MKAPSTFPKLLVATEFPPNASGGGSAVVRQMLEGYPADRIYWWSILPDSDKRFGQAYASHFCARMPPKAYPRRRATRIKSFLLDALWVPWAAHHLRRVIREVSPDCIWVIPHMWSIPVLGMALRNENRPLHVTVQDYPDIRDYPALFGAKRCAQWADIVYELFKKARTRDATSHAMVEDLRERTGAASAQVLHMGIEPSDMEWLEKGKHDSTDCIRIAYAGSIIVEQEFELMIESLRILRATRGLNIILEFFSLHRYGTRKWFDASWMHDNGNLPQRELINALRSCSWGLAPMALTDDDPRYNRFSFPTKFIAYLAAGLPVIILGHPQSTVAQMASEYRVGHATAAAEPARLADELFPVLGNSGKANVFRIEILRCARTEFDAKRTRDTVWSCLSLAANDPS